MFRRPPSIRGIAKQAPQFLLSPKPSNGPVVKSAAALIIGDEILNGKTLDSNSHKFAQFCFRNGVALNRIEVIADDEGEIVEASRRLVAGHDLVVTSGGIGPTHDDITYASIAKAFSQHLVPHTETQRRMDIMRELKNGPGFLASQTEAQLAAARRMALFPEHAEVLFIGEHIWVPVVKVEKKLCILPGIPSLFDRMLNGLSDYLTFPTERPRRIQVFTEQPEATIAPYLTSLQSRLRPCGIQVGSYPLMGQGVCVSLIGKDKEGEPTCLQIAHEVEKALEGRILSGEEIAKKKQ